MTTNREGKRAMTTASTVQSSEFGKEGKDFESPLAECEKGGEDGV